MNDETPSAALIRDLEYRLELADRRAEEARRERDEARDLVSRMEEQVKDSRAIIEQWVEAFDMTLGDNGNWQHTSPHLVDRWNDLVERYNDLLKKWNQFVPDYNAIVAPKVRSVGRPLAASDTQIQAVLKLAKAGKSIRTIMDETNLGMQTVRTIIGREDWTDRASRRRLEKLDYKPIREAMMSARARKRTRNALPKMIAETLAAGTELLKEAKGIK
jgi:hypothetical protein